MRIYSPEVEEQLFLFHFLKDTLNEVSTPVPLSLKRCRFWIRILLFLFTLGFCIACMGFICFVFDIHHEFAIAKLSLLLAMISFIAAEYQIQNHRLYRYGIEEALIVFALGCLTFGSYGLFDHFIHEGWKNASLWASLISSIASYGAYRRYGYHYLLIWSFIASALMLGDLFHNPSLQRIGLLGIFTTHLIFFFYKQNHETWIRLKQEWEVSATLSVFALYLTVNLQLSTFQLWRSPFSDFNSLSIHSLFPTSFYWMSYALIWIIPIVSFNYSLRHRLRAWLDISLILFLLTIVTNKPYLGIERKPWDPILLGVILITVAVLVKRWLRKSPQDKWIGLTSDPEMKSDKRLLDAVATASTVLNPIPSPISPTTPNPTPGFKGGNSGGGGASGTY